MVGLGGQGERRRAEPDHSLFFALSMPQVGKTLDELVSGLREADPLLYRPQEVGSRSER